MTEATPRFCIIVVRLDGDDAGVERTIRSVRTQTHRGWELVVVDAGTSVAEAVTTSTGEFVLLLEPRGWLSREALATIAGALREHDDIDLLYTDEVVHGRPGHVVFRKPEWSPERQRCQDYCGQVAVFRRSVLLRAADLDLGVVTGHELVLRASERARRIVRLPVALHHRRVEASSLDQLEGAVRPASAAATRAHLERLGVEAAVEAAPMRCRIRRSGLRPAVSVVVPTAGVATAVWGLARPLVVGALRSLLEVTDHPRLEVVVVVDPATPPSVRSALTTFDVRLIEGRAPFSFSERCNAGVDASSGEIVVLLNDDVLIEQPDWLTAMVGYFAEPDVGVVGPRLLYADGTLQHAGILLNRFPRHIFGGFAAEDPGPFDLLRVAREVSAVTGACLATTRSLWDELGGLSTDFAVAFNDVDYCLRARRIGRRVVWTPEATLYHFESQTRQRQVSAREVHLLHTRWGEELRSDPYGNPNFEPGQGWWVERQRWSAVSTVRRLADRWSTRQRRAANSAREGSSAAGGPAPSTTLSPQRNP